MYITKIDDKYKYDIEIISIAFHYYKDEDFNDANNDLVSPTKLILLCKSTNFNETKKFIGYNYFKLIFIEPSTYNIHVRPKPFDSTDDLSDIELMTNHNINYLYSLPLIREIKKTQTAPNHSKWEFYFKYSNTKEAFIRIYANNLEIKDLDGEPNLD